jgi:hypothetical protein
MPETSDIHAYTLLGDIVSLKEAERGQIAPVPAPMNIQAYLESKGSGLAKVNWKDPGIFGKRWTAAEWIDTQAKAYRIRPQFLLTVLQGEQGLVNDGTVRDVAFQSKTLPGAKEGPPPAPPGPEWTVRRNGGPKFVDDGTWWLATKGDWKMMAATGAGIPDPGIFPPFDLRKYLGFPNQVKWAAYYLDKFMREWHEANASGNLAARTLTLYGGQKVISGDAETHALLRYTPSLVVLDKRPRIARGIPA